MHSLSLLSDFSCLDIKFCIVLNARGVHELPKSLAMRLIYPGTFLLWDASVWTFPSASGCASSASQFSRRDKPYICLRLALTNHSMPKRASVTRPASAPQALGYNFNLQVHHMQR